MNVAAAAAFGDMPMFLAWATAGCAASVLGVKEGDSTLKDFFGLLVEFQHVDNRENGARRTDTPSPFAGVIADEKSWLKGQVPGYDELQEPRTITRGKGSNLLETSYKAVHSCMVLRDSLADGSQSGWNPMGNAASHLQTSAERPRPYHSGPDAS